MFIILFRHFGDLCAAEDKINPTEANVSFDSSDNDSSPVLGLESRNALSIYTRSVLENIEYGEIRRHDDSRNYAFVALYRDSSSLTRLCSTRLTGVGIPSV